MIAIYMTGLATILLLLVPFIPGLRDIPRLIPVHRLIWHHQDTPAPDSGVPAPGSGVPVPASGAGNGKVPSPSGAGPHGRGTDS
jgi:hypothetical protein